MNRFIASNFRKIKSTVSGYTGHANFNDHNGLFTGGGFCGPFSCVTAFFIKREMPEVVLRPLFWRFGYGRYREDHISILCDEKIIVDCTYRQFLTAQQIEMVKLRPFFVGSRSDLKKMVDNIGADWSDLQKYWLSDMRPPYRFDQYEAIKDPILYTRKSQNERRFIDYLADCP